MLDDSGAAGSDYAGVDEDVDADFNSDEDSAEDVPLDVLLALRVLRDGAPPQALPTRDVRSRALEALGQLEPAALARHAHAVAATF